MNNLEKNIKDFIKDSYENKEEMMTLIDNIYKGIKALEGNNDFKNKIYYVRDEGRCEYTENKKFIYGKEGTRVFKLKIPVEKKVNNECGYYTSGMGSFNRINIIAMFIIEAYYKWDCNIIEGSEFCFKDYLLHIN